MTLWGINDFLNRGIAYLTGHRLRLGVVVHELSAYFSACSSCDFSPNTHNLSLLRASCFSIHVLYKSTGMIHTAQCQNTPSPNYQNNEDQYPPGAQFWEYCTLVTALFICGGIAQMVELLVCKHLSSQRSRVQFPVLYGPCLIKQPNGTLSRMNVQTYIRLT